MQCFYQKNNPIKAKELLLICNEKSPANQDINGFIRYLHSSNMASKFQENWFNK